MPGNRTKNLAASKENCNPHAPLNHACVPASVLPKHPLAWDSIGVGREGVSAEQRGERFKLQVYESEYKSNLFHGITGDLFPRLYYQIWKIKDTGK